MRPPDAERVLHRERNLCARTLFSATLLVNRAVNAFYNFSPLFFFFFFDVVERSNRCNLLSNDNFLERNRCESTTLDVPLIVISTRLHRGQERFDKFAKASKRVFRETPRGKFTVSEQNSRWIWTLASGDFQRPWKSRYGDVNDLSGQGLTCCTGLCAWKRIRRRRSSPKMHPTLHTSTAAV